MFEVVLKFTKIIEKFSNTEILKNINCTPMGRPESTEEGLLCLILVSTNSKTLAPQRRINLFDDTHPGGV